MKIGNTVILTSIKLEDVECLEQVLAVLTRDGWVIPDWLKGLRSVVKARDAALISGYSDEAKSC